MVLNNKFTVGLTGGIGSGKSLVAKRFFELGATIIDTDIIAHRLTSNNGSAIPFIIKSFGKSYITPEGALNRLKMRQLVFANKLEKEKLENIIHPLIRKVCLNEQKEAKGAYSILVVPLLAEKEDWQALINRILVIDCTNATQIQRIKQRSGLTEQDAQSIIDNQASSATRLALADDVLINDFKTVEQLLKEVKILHNHYLKLAKTQQS